VPCGTKAKVFGVKVPNDCCSITVLGAKLLDKAPFLVFEAQHPSDVLYHRKGNRDDLYNIVELCCGIGIGALGFSEAGMKVVAACDWSQPFTEAHAAIHPQVPVVHGDIGDKAVIKQLHSIHGRPSVLMSGFSCQPFSTGGQQRGALDQRSNTLEQSLTVGHLLRSLVVVLECVQDAGTNAMVRNHLDRFCQELGFHLSEVILKLEDVWVSRRCRWWAVLSANFIGQIPLRAFVHSQHPSIPRHVLSSPVVLSLDAIRQLELTGSELEQFLTYEPNLSKLLLRLDVKGPTALHSWGSQVVGCECLCRSAGFSSQTLSSRGLFGILMPIHDASIDSDRLRVRHPHPIEVGLLNGVPAHDWPSNLRLILAGLGQMCSPLHTVWIGSHLQLHFDQVFQGSSQVDPQYQLDCLRALVLEHAAVVDCEPVLSAELPEPPVELPMDLPVDDPALAPWSRFRHEGGADSATLVLADEQVPFCFRLSDLEEGTVAAVIVAFCELTGHSDERVRVLDCQSGLTLAYGQPAAGLCLWVTQYPLEVVQPEEECMDSDPPATVLDEPIGSPSVGDAAPAASSDLTSPASRSASSRPEHLTSLASSRLVSVPPPTVADVMTVEALRRQTMDVESRKQILANQGAVWADDELIWHVSQMVQAARKPSWALLDPIIAAEALKRPCSGLLSAWIKSQPVKPTAILGLVMFDGHWTPFMWTWTPNCMIAASWDVPGSPPPEFSNLHSALALAVGSRTYTAHIVHRKFAVDSYCGICALRFLDNMIRGKMLPTDLGECQYLHSVGRSLFAAHLETVSEVPRVWMFGAGLDAKATERLHALLLEHGVEPTQVKNRSTLLLQAIGIAPAQKALTGGQPWRSLKQAANGCKPAFQLVLPEELELSVQKKAEQGGLRGKRKKAAGPPKPQPKPMIPAALDPAKLSIEEDSFVAPDGSVLSQLQMTDIGPLASGVVLVAPGEAVAYLKASQLVSQRSLALLVLNVDELPVATSLSWSSVRAVLRCQANGEPLIAPGVLVQLGKLLVSPKPVDSIPAVMHATAVCVKLALYRDAIDGDWQQVVHSPVKYALSLLEPLQSCAKSTPDEPCSCPKWHPTSDDVVADPVIDVWRRQWLSSAFRPMAPQQADIFFVNVRLLDSVFDRVLQCSGRGGLFLEPRTLDGRDPLLDFQILWLAKTPIEELCRLQQCNPQICGLARLGSRLGVRCRVQDAPDLAKTLKPNSVFLAAGAKLMYEVGPLPFGMDIGSLSANFAAVGSGRRGHCTLPDQLKATSATSGSSKPVLLLRSRSSATKGARSSSRPSPTSPMLLALPLPRLLVPLSRCAPRMLPRLELTLGF
jgi:hypothetical protein